jgi:hypothetical protein
MAVRKTAVFSTIVSAVITLFFLLQSVVFLNPGTGKLYGENIKIHGVVPVKVTAHGIRQTIKDTTGKKIGQWVEFLEFWNVGEAGNGHSEFDDYEIVKVTKTFQGDRYYDTVKQGYVENGETEIDEKSSWKFKGGPNGKFEWWGSSVQSMQIEDGKYVVYYDGSYPPEEDYPIDNPEAFSGWVEEDDSYYEEGATEEDTINTSAPTVDLTLLEGPKDAGGGTIEFLIKAAITGNPKPQITFSGVSSDRIRTTQEENIYSVLLNQGEILEVTATVSNNLGKASDSITLSGSIEVKPAIALNIISGPTEIDGNKFSFTVEAFTTGTPEPTVTFSRDDSGGTAGKNKTLINIGVDEEYELSANADNGTGNVATARIMLSVSSPLKISLEIIEGPEYSSRVTCSYKVKIVIDSIPIPEDYTIKLGGKSYSLSTGKEGGGKKYSAILKFIIGAWDENSRCEDTQLTVEASNKNDVKNKASASIILPWVIPPEGMFPETYDYLKISKVKGKFQMRREKEMLPNSKEFTENPDIKWAEYQGGGKIWIGDEIKTGDEPLIIEFLEDGSKFMLAPNSWMRITESGIQLKDGEGSFTITKSQDGIKTLKNSFLSNFSFSAITGTSFVINAKNNRTLLKVMEGAVEIYSTAAGVSSMISGGEAVTASEAGLSEKAAFSVEDEESFWENVEKEGAYYERENNFKRISSELGVSTSIMIIIIIEICLLFIALVLLLLLIIKIKQDKF